MDFDALIAAHPHNDRRVFAMQVNGETVWVKFGQKDHRNRLQRMQARLGSRAGAHPNQQEIRSLGLLAERGLNVPRIIHIGGDYIVLSDIGVSLQELSRRAAPETLQALCRAAAIALRRLHEKNCWHGNAQLRNMAYHNGSISFFDFEDNTFPEATLSFKQSYDLWQLAASAAHIDPALVTVVLEHYRLPGPIRLLKRASRLLWPLAALLSPLGSEAVRAARTMNAVRAWRTQQDSNL